jgi:hypothetical protein
MTLWIEKLKAGAICIIKSYSCAYSYYLFVCSIVV